MHGDVPLAGDWTLWPDLAVRSTGFPVCGLEVFGPEESARLRDVARDARFREAVTWQNPAALAHAVDKIATGSAAAPSRTRQREEIVASYWQRYCAKSDTIGFFGPLGWGRVAADGPPLRLRGGAVERERSVHLEAWGVQTLAQTLDVTLHVGAGPHSERDLRRLLLRHPDGATRDHGLAALDRLEAAREALAAAAPDELQAALDALDDTFTDLTGREPRRNAGRAYGARTLAYVDCVRDVELTLGPQLIAELAPALQALFEATRWYCGEVHARGEAAIAQQLPRTRRGPFLPVLRDCLQALAALPGDLADTTAELDRRLTALLADPDPQTLGVRAAAAFADARPAWAMSAFHSVDVQLAARDAAAVAAGDFLAVVGDVHPGINPLLQGLFGHRAPDTGALLKRWSAVMGGPTPWLLPPYAPGIGVEARGVPVTPLDVVHIAATPETRAQLPRRTWLPEELRLDGDDVVHPGGGLRVALTAVLGMPIFVAGVRAFELLPEAGHAPRLTVGRTVLRRESWSVPAADVPRDAQQLPAFARAHGMPRRLFVKSPRERKPMYLDTDSPVLRRIVCRHARQAHDDDTQAHIRFSEMLPAPEACWLTDDAGERYVSELRLVAVDGTRRADQTATRSAVACATISRGGSLREMTLETPLSAMDTP